MGNPTLNSGKALPLVARGSAASRCLNYAVSSGMLKSRMPVTTSDAYPILMTLKQLKMNANVRRIPMFNLIRDLVHDVMLLIRQPKQPSLLANSIDFATNAGWMERLVAYRQLDIWLYNKHKNHE